MKLFAKSICSVLLLLSLALPASAALSGVISGTGGSAGGLQSVVYVSAGTSPAQSGIALSNAFRNLKSGQTLSIGPGLYHVPSRLGSWLDPGLGLTNKINFSVVGSGPGTILSNNQLGTMIAMERCSNFVFANMTLIGTRTNNTSAHDVYSAIITGAKTNGYGLFDSLIVTNNDAHGILFVESGGPAGWGMTYRNCTFAGIGTTLHNVLTRDGAAVFFDNNTTITKCRFAGNVRDIEAWSTKDFSGVQIEGCRFENTIDISLWVGIEATTCKVKNSRVSNCEFYLGTDVAFGTFKPIAALIKGCEGFIFSGNYIEGGAFGIVNEPNFLYPLCNLVISDNIFRGQYWDSINLGRNGTPDLSTNVVITRNQFKETGRDGIRISINRPEISWNRVERTGTNGLGTGYGISSGIATYMPNTNTIIAHNWFTDVLSGGIRLNAEAYTNYVIRNRIEGNAASPVSDAGTGNSITTFP